MGARSLARELKKQLREQCAWLPELKEMCYSLFWRAPCQQPVLRLMKAYRKLVFDGRLDEASVESIKRVINACNTDVLLLDFAPVLRETIDKLKEAAAKMDEKDKEKREEIMEIMEIMGITEELLRKKIMEIAEELEKMKLSDFLNTWDDIFNIEVLGYRNEVIDIYTAISVGSILITTLEEEIRKVAMRRGIDAEELFNQIFPA